MANKKKDSLIVHDGEALDDIYESAGPVGKKIIIFISLGCLIFCTVGAIKFLIMLFTGGFAK